MMYPFLTTRHWPVMHSLTFVIKAAKTEWGASLMPASAPYPILWVNQRSISWTGLFSQVPFFTSLVELYSSRANCSLQEQADCHKTNTICTILPLNVSSWSFVTVYNFKQRLKALRTECSDPKEWREGKIRWPLKNYICSSSSQYSSSVILRALCYNPVFF